MLIRFLKVRIMIHLEAKKTQGDLKKLVREFRREWEECCRLAGEKITPEQFSKACAAERAERVNNMPTKRF